MARRPEREKVEAAYLENSKRKAYEIAEEIGLIETMGYDKATSYIKSVKKSMRKKGQLVVGALATDEERLADVTTLFKLRQGNMSKRAAYFMLLLNCYYRLRSENDNIHIEAIDDTYAKRTELKIDFPMLTAVQVCEAALAQYLNSKDEQKNEAAKKRGYPGAGLNYTDERFIDALEITEDELQHMISIRKEDEHGGES